MLYRMFDANGKLLYVGMTQRGLARFDSHKQDKYWWREVATITIEHYDDHKTLAAAETTAIKNEQPAHNTVHSTIDWTARRSVSR